MNISDEEQRAWRALEAKKYEEAARLYRPLADSGSVHALIGLGWIHQNGFIGRPDQEKAIQLWEEAARLGSGLAKHYLGRAWKDKGDLAKARALFVDGAEQGHKPCMSMAGKMMVRGLGGPVETEAGVAWLVRAAEDGHVFAERELLRLDIQNSRSLLRRIWLYGRLVLRGFVLAPRMARDPYSDDIR